MPVLVLVLVTGPGTFFCSTCTGTKMQYRVVFFKKKKCTNYTQVPGTRVPVNAYSCTGFQNSRIFEFVLNYMNLPTCSGYEFVRHRSANCGYLRSTDFCTSAMHSSCFTDRSAMHGSRASIAVDGSDQCPHVGVWNWECVGRRGRGRLVSKQSRRRRSG